MKKVQRSFEVERNSVDREAGTFEAVVFTDGEARDGHRLDISGARLPASMPMFVNHERDPRSQLGTLYVDRVGDHEVIYRGEILTEGEGPQADERRDLLEKMATGHVRNMSGSFSIEKATPRRELDADHWAHVSKEAAREDITLRYGLLAEEWTALEGSVVGLGSDPAAVARDEGEPETLELFSKTIRQMLDLGYDGETLYCVLEEAREGYRQGQGPVDVPVEEEEDAPLPSEEVEQEERMADVVDLVPLIEETAADVERIVAAWVAWKRGAEISCPDLLGSVRAFDQMHREKYSHG